ncbi:ribonuclease H-like isoform X1 [Magnolia sinica]|uniref:ribonuclease H-like isoform X1 n=1 Tax=Magnolia sinica TaxID=86752 RepID=UPI00265AB2E0|nr:ribonuclease H-like isoform X1 [Magnolia sinica]
MVVMAPDEVWEEYLKMVKEKYYVVLVGRRPGIYLTWDDARVEVEGYNGSRHRAFENWRDATAYWDSFFSLATAPPTHGCGARSGEVGRSVDAVDVHHSAMLSIHRTSRATMLRLTSTDDLPPSVADRLLELLIGVMVVFSHCIL